MDLQTGYPSPLSVPKVISVPEPAAWLSLVAGLVLLTAGLSASIIPARRAVRIDPLVALRER